jgi:prepilin-type processing-associated H-X9-DG protein
MSLVEVLTVISIMGLLASLLLPAIQSARQAARRAQCQNNMKQIGLAIFSHATAMNGQLPGGGAPSVMQGGNPPELQPRSFQNKPAKKERQAWGWAYQILPYLEQENKWANPDDALVRGSHVPIYLCPSQEGNSTNFGDAGAIHYVGNACSNCEVAVSPGNSGKGKKGMPWGGSADGQDGVFVQTLEQDGSKGQKILQKSPNLEQFKDGLSNTILVAEKRGLASNEPCNQTTGWVSGYPVKLGATIYGHDSLFSGQDGSLQSDETDPAVQCTSQAGCPHGVGGNVLFGDGSVRFMVCDVDADFWRALLSIQGKEDIDFETEEVLSH